MLTFSVNKVLVSDMNTTRLFALIDLHLVMGPRLLNQPCFLSILVTLYWWDLLEGCCFVIFYSSLKVSSGRKRIPGLILELYVVVSLGDL